MTAKPKPYSTVVTIARGLSLLGLLAALAGCNVYDDPFDRPGTWRPTYDNDANIAATVVDKSELTKGTEDPRSPAVLSAQAVQRLLTDKVKPLPSTEIGPVGGSSSGGQ